MCSHKNAKLEQHKGGKPSERRLGRGSMTEKQRLAAAPKEAFMREETGEERRQETISREASERKETGEERKPETASKEASEKRQETTSKEASEKKQETISREVPVGREGAEENGQAEAQEDAGVRKKEEEERKAEEAFEEAYLQETVAAAEKQLAQAREAIENRQSEMIAAKRELRENTEHGAMGLCSADGFEALVELNQSLAPITDMAADCNELAHKIRRLEKVIEAPYFARIDFCFTGEEAPEKVYIGRTSLMEKNSLRIYVYDWRSPIASVFYRFMTGEAYYDAPAGRVTGSVERKRQYEIKDGRLLYFFDTDIHISDAILKRLLSKNVSPQMKTVVETIQKEQDIVIRNMENDLLMIQGAAGSGKTSVALHRAAYLLYRGMQSGLCADNILILSPNAVFEEYISNVLPELGEENVVSRVFEEILYAVLKKKAVQSQNAFWEEAVSDGMESALVKDSMRFKTSKPFQEILNRLTADIPRQEAAHPELASMDAVSKLCVLYRLLWEEEAYFAGAEAAGVGAIRRYTLENLEAERLHFDDATAICYLYLKRYDYSDYRNIRQVIIDEAQDYYPLQYEIFHLLFPYAKYTVLGDINQTLNKQEDISFYKEVASALRKKNTALVMLDKSFRCTNEILQFGLQFIDGGHKVKSFNRKGEAVEVRDFDTHEAYLQGIVGEVESCREKGYETICLLCKTEESCKRLYAGLHSRMDIRMLQSNVVEKIEGTLLLPCYMAKGLEFDAVLVCDADALHYSDADDKKILYVACTRALHRLSLYSDGEMTPFISRAG